MATLATVLELAPYEAPQPPVDELTLRRQRLACLNQPALLALLEAHPVATAVLNGSRQIVAANGSLRSLTLAAGDALIGQRLGEAVGCERSVGRPGSCGTQPGCELCGAARVFASLEATRRPVAADCRITTESGALDLRVSAGPLPMGGELLTMCAVEDTSDARRRESLERIFFHDALNVAGALQDYLGLMTALGPEDVVSTSRRLAPLADQLVDEIQAQRDLVEAERGELVVRPTELPVAELFARLDAVHRQRAQDSGVALIFEEAPAGARVRSDAVLLRRVLGNLVKNALEASSPGDTVRVSHAAQPPAIEVHNPAVMTEAVRLQMFQRSFSTKEARGRGLGAYSVKLLTERYLGGQVTFSSEPERGTTFRISL